ncbi:MAG: DUF2147 domain-containing protein [Caulobacteraceae bacterium]|nr:DUF2147 domain-containing protein [Caulobacteraceae bacterium]
MTRLFLILVATGLLAFDRPHDVTGRWRTGEDNGVVQVSVCGSSVCGRLLTSDRLAAHPDQRDERNHDRALKSRRLSGMLLFDGFQATARGWEHGRIYNPADGYTYEASLRLLGPDRLEVKGCALKVLCRTQVWRRMA